MEPNSGAVVGDLRVLLLNSSSRRQHWYWWLVALVTGGQGDAERQQYEVRVVSTATSSILATRTFDDERQAKRARGRFVELAEDRGATSHDPPEVQALLNSSPSA